MEPDEKTITATEEGGATKRIINLSLNDPEHPNNWSTRSKSLIVALGNLSALHSTFGSSLPSNAITPIVEYFRVQNEIQKVLPTSCFLIGFVFGPTICGPLSEHIGRRKVMVTAFGLYTLWTMSCAVAPSWGSFLFFRFASGASASAPIVCVSGLYTDIFADPRARGRSMVLFMITCLVGPACAPPIGGFIAENTSWRWVFGTAALFCAASFPLMLLLSETYAPTLASQRAARLRKTTGDMNIVAQPALEGRSFNYVFTKVMARPFKMLFQEVIVSSTCAYVSLCYGVLYLYFPAYAFIFLGPDSVYKWSPGVAGLAFLPIPIGSVMGGAVCLWWDAHLAAAQTKRKSWAGKEEYRRLPIALIGGPLFGISMIWLGWASRPEVFWLAPVASGVLFGAGYSLIFVAMLNYLSDAYITFAASAQSMASISRSIFGVLLPLATSRMFKTLGISWACSLLGFLSLLFAGVPVLYICYGDKIRANSKFCQEIHRQHKQESEQQVNP